MTEREKLVKDFKLEDMTYEAYKFLIAREFKPYFETLEEAERYVNVVVRDWREYYDDGYTPDEAAREDRSYWSE